MRFVRMLAAGAALACAGLSGQAQAAKVFTITGTIVPDEYGYGSVDDWFPLPQATSPYTQGLYISFSRPVTATILATINVDYVKLDRDGNIVAANNFEDYLGGDITNARALASRHASPVLSINGLRRLVTVRDSGLHIDLWGAPGDAPVSYTLSGFAGVPEPATWALMIVGFGAIGAAIRRNRSAPANRHREGAIVRRIGRRCTP